MTSREIDLRGVGVEAPPVPSKWDIIPLHTSDRSTFKNCRRRWDWSSPARNNLTRKVRIHGVNWSLLFGSGIHYALQRYYDPRLREDPVVTFNAWLDLQWKGGLITEEELKDFGFEDRNPQVATNNVLKVVGLEDLLPDPDPTVYEEHKDLGTGMMEFYKNYAEREDNFSTISVEHTFSIPILMPDGSPLYMIDNRTMPDGWEPNLELENVYGPLMRWDIPPDAGYDVNYDDVLYKQVHARGRMDKIIQDNENGQYGIHDYKTTARLPDDDYFRHLNLDEQVTTYAYAAEREAEMYGLEYKTVDFIIYEALFKAYPKPPTVLKSGLPSINRQTESTTAEMYVQWFVDNGLMPLFESDEKYQNYYTWMLETGDERFINRYREYRNKAQKENCGKRLYLEAMDMLDNPRIYPSPRKEYLCLNCDFRTPCLMAETGGDYEYLLKENYTENYDR